jgi:YegS/Rv2252/BmrU family lipid kinase
VTEAPAGTPPDVLLIVNPAARNGDAARLESPLSEWADARGGARVLATRSPAEASAAAAASSGSRVVIAVGGDGTVNAVVNGLMAVPAAARPALGVLPAGSGNDFSRMIGVAADPMGAVDRVLGGRARLLDVGSCNGRWFINAVSIGLDARVAERATEIKESTGRSGLGLYLSAVGPTLLHDLTPHDVCIAWDGEAAEPARVTLIAVTNGTTYGGGFKVAPDAMPDDGLFDTVVVDEMGLLEASWRVPSFVLGWHTRMRPVHMGRHAFATIESTSALPAQIDGEIFRATRFDIQIEPGALAVMSPALP